MYVRSHGYTFLKSAVSYELMIIRNFIPRPAPRHALRRAQAFVCSSAAAIAPQLAPPFAGAALAAARAPGCA